jgi:hypothetical protein
MNTAVKFNGREYIFAFLMADVPFPIISLDFLRYFGMQVKPSSPVILITPTSSSQGGGNASDGDVNAPSLCFSVQREAPLHQSKVATSACPIHPRIMKLLEEEFPELLGLSSAAHQPKHGVVHHILMDGRPVFAKAHRLHHRGGVCRLRKGRYCITSPWASPLHMVPKNDGS